MAKSDPCLQAKGRPDLATPPNLSPSRNHGDWGLCRARLVWLEPSPPLGLARPVLSAFWPKPDRQKLTLLGITAAAPCVLKLASSATGPGSSTAACTLPPWRLPGYPGCSLHLFLLPAPLPTPKPHPRGADHSFSFSCNNHHQYQIVSGNFNESVSSPFPNSVI